jgi:hypothetical protein
MHLLHNNLSPLYTLRDSSDYFYLILLLIHLNDHDPQSGPLPIFEEPNILDPELLQVSALETGRQMIRPATNKRGIWK